ncbi:MAG: aminopeptidase P family protein [Oscillospiraceae bacterium]|nr:aminopeptidase P family protein [Oscillospiraceae bacterium]
MPKSRIEKIQQTLRQKPEPTALLVASEENRRYLTDIATSSGYVMITPENKYFFTDFRYLEFAKKSLGELYEVALYPKENYNEILKKENIKNILFEENYISLKTKKSFDEMFCDFALCESGGLIEEMRKIKDESELENIKRAQHITDKAFGHILKLISQNINTITESDIALELEYFMRKNGAEAIAFDTIAVSGKKSSYPHGQPENIKLSNGFLTLDFGAKYRGYCADMTRTICVSHPSEKMTEVYNTVKSAQAEALNMIKANADGLEIDTAARAIIDGAGYGKNFGHGLGHSVGLEIHESPNFPNSEKEKDKQEDKKTKLTLFENLVITVEPGIYIEDEFGVRIEDLVVVTKDGCENLTASDKELICI